MHTTETLEAKARAKGKTLAISFASGRFICGIDHKGVARFSFWYHTEPSPRSYPSRRVAEAGLARLYEKKATNA